jgi:hypothetical protein
MIVGRWDGVILGRTVEMTFVLNRNGSGSGGTDEKIRELAVYFD